MTPCTSAATESAVSPRPLWVRAFKRPFDVALALCLLVPLAIPMVIIAVLVRLTSEGPAFYWSDRVGINNTIFRMPKFRSMRLGAPQLATHLFDHPEEYLTPLGRFLRRTSLDELPQIFSILRGDISLVGPRPALFNQSDLVLLRTQRGIHRLLPGLTGWAQVNGRDNLPIRHKVEFDDYYLRHQSFSFDIKILALTVLRVVRGEGVKH